MLRFLIDKLKKAPGPMPQMRLVLGDLAEEVLDLSEHYAKRLKARVPLWPDAGTPEDGSKPKEAVYPAATIQSSQVTPAAPRPAAKPKSAAKSASPAPALELSPRLSTAIGKPSYHKKQEFKVLAILWDSKQRELGPLSAKAIAAHGEKIGISIRHENVRKVIRMRLDKHVEVHTEEAGTGSIYRYQISQAGLEYFETTYFN